MGMNKGGIQHCVILNFFNSKGIGLDGGSAGIAGFSLAGGSKFQILSLSSRDNMTETVYNSMDQIY